MEEGLLQMDNVSIEAKWNKREKTITNQVSFSIKKGEILGIVGESGSGKSMTALSILDLLPKNIKIKNGNIIYNGRNIVNLSDKERRVMNGNEISMIFQEPMSSLNPVMKVGLQVEEALRLHSGLGKGERKERTLAILNEVGLEDAPNLYHKYPHQLSGGMRQRVMIAMAMVCRPGLLIADEPTTALDVEVQEKIVKLIERMSKKHGTAVLLISHDLGVIRSVCKRAVVMQEGGVVEEGLVTELFQNPKAEYTRRLIEALPGKEKKRERQIPLKDKILEVRDLSVSFEERHRWYGKKQNKQVLNNVNFTLYRGEILGLAGRSGIGKSTMAKAITSLVKYHDGTIEYYGKKPQMVFQDPYSSLNPVKKVGWLLEEPLKIQGGYSKEERKRRVRKILKQVGLEKEHLKRRVSKLSGGQRQRVAIACALISKPDVVILDEPVSALDVTIQDKILALLASLREGYDVSYLLISHDKAVLEQMCDRVIEL